MLTLVLESPGLGMISPYVTGGSLDYMLDRYPRWRLTADLRPDPNAVHLWQSPYRTRAHVIKPDGSMLFSGPLHQSQITRPDGNWSIEASDDTMLLRQFRTSNRPGQFLPGTTMDIRAFIAALASMANAPITTSGSGGLVDVRDLDIAGAEAWSLVEEQLIANNLDVWPQGDGTLMVGPTAAMKQTPDYRITVGEAGTITSYTVVMSRIYNKVILTHEATKTGASDTKYVDGVWTDSTSSAGTSIGINPYTRTVRVGEEWYDDPVGHQAAADAAAASVAQTVRGFARQATVEIVPRYDITVGNTIEITFLVGTTDRFLVVGASWPMTADGTLRLEVRNSNPDWPSQFFIEEREASHGRSYA